MQITLKNLHEATAQQVFDQVATHLLTQMARSTTGLGCAYRGPNNLKCAAGCLIADDEYNSSLEHKLWICLVNEKLVTEHHQYLISELQRIHDSKPIYCWNSSLASIAKDFNLKMVEI